MYNISLKNIRCFYEEQSVLMKPITILIGENSSGKSTFLAMTRIAWDLISGKQNLDFNEEPFVLGSFDQIATFRGGNVGRAKEFQIGIQKNITLRNKKELVKVTGKFISEAGKPRLSLWTLNVGKYQVIIRLSKKKQQTLIFKTPTSKYKSNNFPDLRKFSGPIGLRQLFSLIRFLFFQKGNLESQTAENKTLIKDLEYLEELGNRVTLEFRERPYAIAPIRTKPSVTYDPFKDLPSPEGAHIPILLAKISSTDAEAWEILQSSLDSFGQVSGLFDDVEVRRMGNKEGDPFQVTIKISGPPFNLAYVGYGVSQVLPILVESIQAPKNSTFLLQQPEVHLHPKAQAELGSFLASIAKHGNKNFIIETHSDYFLDRIRMDIRDKKLLKADDVSILYFEREGGTVSIKPMGIDDDGNLINVPSGYRQFFLEEERRMIFGG